MTAGSITPAAGDPAGMEDTEGRDGRLGHRMLILTADFGHRMTVAVSDRLGSMEVSNNTPVLLLCHLATRGPLRPRTLQAATGLTSGGMTKQLDRLEHLGLIERSFGRVRGDRRAILISLTPEGRRVADAMAETVEERLDEVRSFSTELADLVR
jgi:DNA-binding MarR family transcriptional regulator